MTLPPAPVDQTSPNAAPEPPPVVRAPAGRSWLRIVAVTSLVLACIGAVLSALPDGAWPTLVVFALAAPLAVVALLLKSQRGTMFAVIAFTMSVFGCFVATGTLLSSHWQEPLTAHEAQQMREELFPSSADSAVPDESPETLPPLQPASPPLLTFADSGFGRDPATGEWWYVMVVDNADTRHTHVDTPITAVAIGADRTPLQTELLNVSFSPGRTVVAGFFTGVRDSDVVSIDSVIRSPLFSIAGSTTQLLEVKNVTETIDSAGIATVNGEVTNVTTSSLDAVVMTAVAYDADGTIFGFAKAEVDPLAAGETRTIDVRFAHALPAGATFEVFAQDD